MELKGPGGLEFLDVLGVGGRFLWSCLNKGLAADPRQPGVTVTEIHRVDQELWSMVLLKLMFERIP